MWDNSPDMSRTTRLRQDGIQRFHHKVKQEGREWVSLTHSPPIPKGIPHLAIDGDSGLAPRDQTERAVHPPRVKAFSKKDLAQETLVHPIIGLLEVQLQENSPEFLRINLMDNLLERQDSLVDVSALYERSLVSTNSPMSYR
jgi:hypothetical protein